MERSSVARFGFLASAIANRPVQVAPGVPGDPAWTDGKVVFIDAQRASHEQLTELAVQAALLAAGSLGREITSALVRRPALTSRYLAVEAARASVRMMPVKRFAEGAGALMLQRLDSLEPGAYSRLGAAIRHGTALLQDHRGTPRQLLVVLSDGLAYDHGYEPAYGAADAARALGEARSQGVACLCLSIGASAEHESLRRVFGRFAHAALPTPDQLGRAIGPLFRSAIRSADVRRRVA